MARGVAPTPQRRWAARLAHVVGGGRYRYLRGGPPSEVKQVGRFWDLARQTPDGFEDYAKQVARLFVPRAPVLEQLLDLLFHIAKSDGDVTGPELSFY